MPFERRSGVQVLEDDGSDNVMQRRAAIASVLDALRSGVSHKLAACKTLAIRLALPFLLHFSLICPKRPLPRLNRFSGPPCGASKSEVSIAACVLPVQQVTHCTRERIEDNVFLLPRK